MQLIEISDELILCYCWISLKLIGWSNKNKEMPLDGCWLLRKRKKKVPFLRRSERKRRPHKKKKTDQYTNWWNLPFLQQWNWLSMKKKSNDQINSHLLFQLESNRQRRCRNESTIDHNECPIVHLSYVDDNVGPKEQEEEETNETISK